MERLQFEESQGLKIVTFTPRTLYQLLFYLIPVLLFGGIFIFLAYIQYYYKQ